MKTESAKATSFGRVSIGIVRDAFLKYRLQYSFQLHTPQLILIQEAKESIGPKMHTKLESNKCLFLQILHHMQLKKVKLPKRRTVYLCTGFDHGHKHNNSAVFI